MRLFHVIPFLSLLLGARASPRVLNSGESVPHRVEARQIGTNVCIPVAITTTIVGLLPAGLVYLNGGTGMTASGSTFSCSSL